MAALRASDLRDVVDLVEELHSVDTEEPFPSEVLGRFAQVIPADTVHYNERDVVGRQLLGASEWCRDGGHGGDDEPSGDEAWEYVLHHPTNVYRRRTRYNGVLADSDLWDRVTRGGDDSLGVRLTDSSTHTATFWLSSERDFNARDKLVLDTLRPHLVARRLHARLRRLLSDALAALAFTSEATAPHSVVLVGSGGRMEFVSPAALELLHGYFGRDGTSLPEPLEEWRGHSSAKAFSVVHDGQRLVVEAVGPGRSALLLREEPAPVATLTAREWDVMRWVDMGKTNDEIAELLWVTPGTVKKHLEHVYAKLGVRTRTAAVARLRPQLVVPAS